MTKSIIIYACVSNQHRLILSDFEIGAEGAREVVQRVMASRSSVDGEGMATTPVGEYLFHLLVKDGVRYACLGDKAPGTSRLAYLLLEDMCQRFTDKFGVTGRTAIDNTPFRAEFSGTLEKLLTKYNDPAVDKVTALRSELENVRDAAMMNIDRVLERGERLEGMAEKTSLLSERAQMFNRASTRLRRDMWWQSVKMKVLFAVLALVAIVALAYSICGWGLQSCTG